MKISERMIAVETDLKYLKKSADEQNKKIDTLIEKFDGQSKMCFNTFATKAEVNQKFAEKKTTTRWWLNWAPAAVTAILAIMTFLHIKGG